MYGYNNGPRASPVVDGDRVFTYGVAGRLSAVEVATGRPLWELDVNREYGVIQNFFGVGSTPCVFNDLLIVMVGGSRPHKFVNRVSTRRSQTQRFSHRSFR